MQHPLTSFASLTFVISAAAFSRPPGSFDTIALRFAPEPLIKTWRVKCVERLTAPLALS
jgi:hypothetical protein